jgi:hypothetical protein
MATQLASAPRASISARTLRTDRWWVSPTITFAVLTAFVAYSTWAAIIGRNYFYKWYISPFYSPCIASDCTAKGAGNVVIPGHTVAHWALVPPAWTITPAIIVLIVPLGFRLTCYYYRRAYYRAFWQSPPACAVAEPHKRYTGETRFPLILQNVHRYFFYLALLLNCILTYDVALGFGADTGGHVGLGSFVLLVNAGLLWMYTLSCHSCRHIIGGRLRNFSKHPIRFRFWGFVSKLNARHMQIAWASLIWVALTDMYIRLAAAGWIGHGGWI